MLKQKVSIVFGIIFVTFLVTPTIISIIDDSIDISVFYTSTEEEDKGFEKDKIDFISLDNSFNQIDFFFKNSEDNLTYYSKKYPKPYLNLLLPPPQHTIL